MRNFFKKLLSLKKSYQVGIYTLVDTVIVYLFLEFVARKEVEHALLISFAIGLSMGLFNVYVSPVLYGKDLPKDD